MNGEFETPEGLVSAAHEAIRRLDYLAADALVSRQERLALYIAVNIEIIRRACIALYPVEDLRPPDRAE